MKPYPRQPKPLADLMSQCLGPALAAQGFAATDIISAWPEIAGERLSRYSQPIRIDWPRRARRDAETRPEPGALQIRVESAFALEFQHLAPVIVERINAHYGWRCIGRLVLKQGPIRRKAEGKRAAPALAETERARIAAAVTSVEGDSLRAALERLGTAVIGDRRGR